MSFNVEHSLLIPEALVGGGEGAKRGQMFTELIFSTNFLILQHKNKMSTLQSE